MVRCCTPDEYGNDDSSFRPVLRLSDLYKVLPRGARLFSILAVSFETSCGGPSFDLESYEGDARNGRHPLREVVGSMRSL